MNSGEQELKAPFLNDLIYSVGISAGQETFIGFPKLGAYKEFPLSLIDTLPPRFGFKEYSIYTGAELSLFVLFAGVFSISGNVGCDLGPVTIDNTFTYTLVTSPESDNSNYSTYNPKLGLNIGPLWLKSGPSLVLDGSPDWGNWFEVEKIPFNIELHYLIKN